MKNNVPVYKGIKVDRCMYCICCAILAAEELKSHGLMCGGYDTVDKESLKGMVDVAEFYGYDKPTKEELASAYHAINRDLSGDQYHA